MNILSWAVQNQQIGYVGLNDYVDEVQSVAQVAHAQAYGKHDDMSLRSIVS
jgi:hypothetical protein